MQLNEIAQQIGLDEESVLRRFSGNRALMERFLHKFPQDATFAALAAAMDTDDREELFRAAHTLKGISANLGLDRLCAGCARMVENLRAGRDETAADFAEIAQEYGVVTEWLSRMD